MDINTLSDSHAFELAMPIWEMMKHGSNTGDYNAFSRCFSTELKNRLTQERFLSQRKEFPLLSSLGDATPVACIRRKEGISIIFKQLSPSLEGEFIGQLTLSGNNDKPEVINAQVY